MKKLTGGLLRYAMREKGKRLEIRDSDEPGLTFRVTELEPNADRISQLVRQISIARLQGSLLV